MPAAVKTAFDHLFTRSSLAGALKGRLRFFLNVRHPMARQLALVSEVEAVSADELHKIAAALQKQLDRDFTPLWDIKAAIKSFTSLEDVPENCWPVILRTDIETPAALAAHLHDQKEMPFALVQFGDGWSLSASHQVLEMLANPFSNRLLARRSVKPGERHNVQYLVQVCDPCQNAAYAYHIDGIMV